MNKSGEVKTRASYQTAIEALQNQLKKSHQESMKYFAQRAEAISQLNAIANGAKLKATAGKNTQYAALYEANAAYESAANAIERSLLTNNFQAADFTGIKLVNVPSHFRRGDPMKQMKPDQSAKEEETDNDEIIYCGA